MADWPLDHPMGPAPRLRPPFVRSRAGGYGKAPGGIPDRTGTTSVGPGGASSAATGSYVTVRGRVVVHDDPTGPTTSPSPAATSPQRESEVLLERALPASSSAVRQRDQEALEYYQNLPKRQKTVERGWLHAEWRNMARGDRESRIFQTIDIMLADLRAYKEMELKVAVPDAKFKCGQSVLQWWAGWMKSAEETPQTYKKTLRPAWFSAEVCSYKEYGTMKYAGQLFTEHLYIVCPGMGVDRPRSSLNSFSWRKRLQGGNSLVGETRRGNAALLLQKEPLSLVRRGGSLVQGGTIRYASQLFTEHLYNVY